MFGQISDMFGHFHWSSCAIQTQTGDWKWLQCVHHRGHVAAKQHGACGFHGHTHQNWNVIHGAARLRKRVNARVDSALHLQQILACFNHETIHTAIDQSKRLLAVGIKHAFPIGVAQRDQLCARPHGARHKARLILGAVLVARRARNLRAKFVQLARPRHHLWIKVRAHKFVGSKCVGLHNIGAGQQKSFVNALNHVWARLHKNVGAIVAT